MNGESRAGCVLRPDRRPKHLDLVRVQRVRSADLADDPGPDRGPVDSLFEVGDHSLGNGLDRLGGDFGLAPLIGK